MMMEAVILDPDGIPYSPERFHAEPECAQVFLEHLEGNSYRVLKHWRDLTNDEILHEASYRLHCIQQDLISAEFLKSKGMLQ